MLRPGRTRPTTPSTPARDPNISAEASAHSAHSSPERRVSVRGRAQHWAAAASEVTLTTRQDSVFNFRVVGGSDWGEFPVVAEVLPPDTRGVEYCGQGELTTQASTTSIGSNNQSKRNVFRLLSKLCNMISRDLTTQFANKTVQLSPSPNPTQLITSLQFLNLTTGQPTSEIDKHMSVQELRSTGILFRSWR